MSRLRHDRSPEDIAYLLARRGWTYTEVERAYGLTPNTAYKAAVRPLFNAELAIADAIGVSPREIWPSRYDQNGTRHKPQPQKNYRPKPRARHCKKKEVA